MASTALSSGATTHDYLIAPSVSQEGDRTVVWLDGEHDIATRFVLTHTLETAFSTHDGDVVVDLSGVTFIGAATVHELVRGRDVLRGQSRNLTLRSPSRGARRLLEVLELNNLVEPNG